MSALVIIGSARAHSDTLNAVKKLCPFLEYKTINLIDKTISHYNYEGDYPQADEFLEIAKEMQAADNIIFATPVYWYAMSGELKVFFDRLTDLMYGTNKAIGKSLAGKKTYLISTGSEELLPEGFEVPFKNTSEYFGMEFKQTIYIASKELKVL